MARIRTIKPEFPHSESMGRVSRDARLLFLMLFTIVDDAGRTRAASRMLASLLYPYDDDAKAQIDGWLSELEREQCILLYDVEGNAYLQIEKWLEHQKIDRPSKSRFPEPQDDVREHSSKSREPSSTDLVPRTVEGISKTGEPELFHKFFDVFPKQEQREPAARAYAAALGRGATDTEMLAGAQRYAAHVSREKTELKFVALAKTWLKDGCWRDMYGQPAVTLVEVVIDPSWGDDRAQAWSQALGDVNFKTYFAVAEFIDSDPPILRYRSHTLRRLAGEKFPKQLKSLCHGEVVLEVAA